MTLPYLRTAHTYFQGTESTDPFNYSDITNEICGIIDEYTEPDDPISVIGNWDIIYVAGGRPHATTYSCPYPIVIAAPAILDDYFRQLAEDPPNLIVVSSSYYYPPIESFLIEHGYSRIWVAPEGSSSDATIYSRRA